MQATKATHFSEKNRLDVEWELPILFNKAKAIMKEDVFMKFYDGTRPQYLETDISGVGLGAGLLQIRDRMNCP